MIGYIVNNNNGEKIKDVLILCNKGEESPIIYLRSNKKIDCLSCSDEIKNHIEGIEIDYNDLNGSKEKIINHLKIGGWNCK